MLVNQHLLLFLQFFLPVFQPDLIYHLQMISIWTCLKICRLVKFIHCPQNIFTIWNGSIRINCRFITFFFILFLCTDSYKAVTLIFNSQNVLSHVLKCCSNFYFLTCLLLHYCVTVLFIRVFFNPFPLSDTF